jgi:cytochrome b561
MKHSTQITAYSFRSKILHALIAIMVLGLLFLGMFLDKLPSFLQNQGYMLHKSFGILVLILMIVRIGAILKDGRPQLPKHVKNWERKLARAVQYSFYLVLILMPLTGWIMSVADGYIPTFFELFNLDLPFIPLNKELAKSFSQYHYYLAWLIGGLVILHVLGNVKHYFIDKDKVIQTMWDFKNKNR